jgi:hypothetical protein
MTLPQYFISPVNESLGGNNYLDKLDYTYYLFSLFISIT